MELGGNDFVDFVSCVCPYKLDGVPDKRYGDPEGEDTDGDAEI